MAMTHHVPFPDDVYQIAEREAKRRGLSPEEWIVATVWFWNWFWLFAKIFVVATLFLWVRATFPRFRYDQIMRLGWKIFIPVTLVWLVLVGLVIQSPWNIWK